MPKSTPSFGRLISIFQWLLMLTLTVIREWAIGLRYRIMFNYIIQRGGRVELKPIDAVPTTWESPLAVFEATLAHEQKVTSLINNLFALTTSENDYATQSMLKWFIDEQVEEEENAQNIIDNLKMIQGNGYGLYMLDKELSARKYTQASPLATKA